MTMSIPSGFQALARLGKLSVQVLEVLVRTQRKQMKRKMASASQSPELFKTQKRRYSDFHEACPCLSEPDVNGATIEKLSVLAIIIYCSTNFTPTRSNTVLFDTCRNRLQGDIATIKPDSAAEVTCLVWVAAMLVWSWTTVSGKLTKEGISCLGKLKSTILRGISWTGLETILGQFFWSDSMSKSLEVHYLSLDTG